MKLFSGYIFGILITLALPSLFTQCSLPRDKDPGTGIAPVPPMGWNSWDCFGFGVNEAQVKATADYMAKHLSEHGWKYVVIDMGWYFSPEVKSSMGTMTDPPMIIDSYGRLLPDKVKFPSSSGGEGFRPLAEYIHGKGLKIGIHIMRGIPWKAVAENTPVKGTDLRAGEITDSTENCEWSTANIAINTNSPALQEYYNSIFELYAQWGIDFVKVDDVAREYRKDDILAVEKAIDACGRQMVLSLSPGPAPVDKAEFFSEHANLYRISNDFWDDWKYVRRQFDYCKQWVPWVKANHWPDADMLPFGKLRITGGDEWVAGLLNDRYENIGNELSRLTDDEKKTVFTLWSIFRSPLMYGGYLPESDSFSIAMLKNDEVLNVNQHSANNRVLFQSDNEAAWTALDPVTGDIYLALFNTGEEKSNISVTASHLSLKGAFKARDLWMHKALGSFTNEFAVDLPPHGCGLYRISK